MTAIHSSAPTRAAATPAAPRVLTEPLGGGALARAALAGEAPGWFAPAPRGIDAWRAHAGRVAASVGAGWLAALRPALGAPGTAAHARLERVARAGGVVVTTGQQPGLFGGPIYTWSKAMSALALADELEARLGVPVAPVFWAATDDADLAEASETWVAVPGGAERLRVHGQAAEGTPMSAVPLPALDAELAVLARGAGSAAGVDVLDLARASYAPGETVGGAYLRLLRALLEPMGIAVLDAADPSVRRAGAPVLRAALANAAGVEAALAAREAEVRAAGHLPQVAQVEGRALVFSWEGGTKRRLGIDEAGDHDPGGDDLLSPNVLLRPVMERAILPTVAYLAGPGELAYFAQVSAVADAIGAAAPLALPRWSCTILEPHVERVLERHGLTMEELADPHAAERRLSRAAMPAELLRALDAWRAAAAEGAEGVRAAAAGLLHDRVADGALAAMQQRVDRVERRALAAVAQREQDTMRDVATARGALWPGGMRQERALNLLPLLARHGTALLDAMAEQARVHAARLVAG